MREREGGLVWYQMREKRKKKGQNPSYLTASVSFSLPFSLIDLRTGGVVCGVYVFRYGMVQIQLLSGLVDLFNHWPFIYPWAWPSFQYPNPSVLGF